MTAPRVRPYGSWSSPVRAAGVAVDATRLAQPVIDGADLLWLERRPAEGGRTVVARERAGRIRDVTPPGLSVRSRVHEYGGGAYLAVAGAVLFSSESDNGLYLQPPDEMPCPVLIEPGLRFADFDAHPAGDWIVCVCEDHRDPASEARNSIMAVDLLSRAQEVLAQGGDFYASPRFSPDGRHLAWITWNHPHLPWDETELWVAEVVDRGHIATPRKLAGGPRESLLQPEWDPAGGLTFLSDRTGWWNVYRCLDGHTEALTTLTAEIGGPLWNLGTSWYGLDRIGRAICIVNVGDRRWLGVLPGPGETPRPLDLPYTSFRDLRVQGSTALVLAGSPAGAEVVLQVDLEQGVGRVVRSSSTTPLAREYISSPEVVRYPGSGGEMAHAMYYPPCNPGFQGPEGERPPLIVMGHGGPTSQTSTVFDLEMQFWTSRGFGVLDVDYGGSTGYGRRYRERLYGGLGEIDVDDCIAGALFLAARGDADPARLVIRGRSAGGYIALAAMTFRDAFAAGASYYGIGDLAGMVESTHKFESRYMETLLGPYPERADLFRSRSPMYHAESIRTPVILFQGMDDAVVPPEQAERLAAALRRHGVPFVMLRFPGEGHGFRQAETIARCLEAELYFYGRILGFTPSGSPRPAPIENLPAAGR